MKSWGRYELVAAPADADLILELHFAAPTGAVDVTNGSGGSAQHPQFRLVIRDVKTNTVLWTFTERLQTASRRAAHDQSFDQAMDKIVDDIKSHLVRTPVTPEAPGK